MSESTEPPFIGRGTRSPFSKAEMAKRELWYLVQATVFKFSPQSFHRWRAWLLKLFGAKIENIGKVVIFPSARITLPWNLSLADRVMIGRKVTIYNLAEISLGRGANISQNSHLCAGSHDYMKWDMPLTSAPITIGANVWIAADVFVGPGVTIGELSVVGARSVVVNSLPAFKICVGHPCRPIKDRATPV